MEATSLFALPEGMVVDQIQITENGLLIEVIATSVNACVILRRDNFDHPFILCFLLVDSLQGSPSHLFCH